MPFENPPTAVIGTVGEPDQRERLVDRARTAHGGHARELGVQAEDLAGAQPRLVAEQLGQVADPFPRRAIAKRRAEDPSGPLGSVARGRAGA